MISGIITALVTPFDKNGSIDFVVLKKLIQKQINDNVDGLLILGTTAEVSVLTTDEQLSIVDFIYNLVYKKLKIIVGIGSNDTQEVIRKDKLFSKYDIDAYLVITPYYNKPNESGMYEHFKVIADSVDKQVILYNVPKRTGVSLSFDNILKLKKHPNIIGLKEASGDINFLQDLVNIQDENFYIYNADDALNFVSIALGVKGLMSVVTNVIGDVVVKMNQAYIKNEVLEANKLHNKYLELSKLLFLETSPIMTKVLLCYLGYGLSNTRLPLGKASDDNVSKLIRVAQEVINT